MSEDNLTEAEKKFLAFDWSKSTEWQTYFSNLYPTPDMSKVPKFKRTWFRRNVDSSLGENSTVGDPVSPKKESSTSTSSTSSSKPTSSSSSTKWPTSRLFEKFQNKTRLPLLTELVLRVELVLLLGFVFSTLVVLSSRFRAPGSENLVKNSRTLSKSFFIMYLLVGLFREKGVPKFTTAWFTSLLSDHHVQYLMYGTTFLTAHPRFLYYLPQLMTAVLSLNSLYKSYPSVFPRMMQSQKVKDLMTKLDQNQHLVLKSRASLELFLLPYVFLSSFVGRNSVGNMVPVFLYVTFLKFKLNARDTYLMNTLKTLHMTVLNYLSHPKVPPAAKTVYQKVVKSLDYYFTGRRR